MMAYVEEELQEQVNAIKSLKEQGDAGQKEVTKAW